MIWKGALCRWGEQPRCTQRLLERLEVALPQAGRLGSVAPDLLATGMSGGNGKHQPGDETRLSKVLIPTELAAFGS